MNTYLANKGLEKSLYTNKKANNYTLQFISKSDEESSESDSEPLNKESIYLHDADLQYFPLLRRLYDKNGDAVVDFLS